VKSELDARDFGTLCHAALEAMGREPALRDCTDAVAIRNFLLAALDREATARFGAELTLPLLVQLESARQRLSRAATVQAESRADGWVIVEVERGLALEIGGLKVTGKIDRIDRHESTGAVRVLDYKTSDKPEEPRSAHLGRIRQGEAPPEFARYRVGGGKEIWRDLQLPLYLRSLAGQFPGEITGGYFNLPKAATETGIALWEDYSPALADSAWTCASGVAAAIQAGQFWPPSETIREEEDNFAALFHHGAAASVAWPEVSP
jgi:ATP-dependent helicase/nuclease subunit B